MRIITLQLENLLSFQSLTLDLGPLNVLIGANGAGKSNLIKAISLLQALPTRDRLSRIIAEGGGPPAWVNRRTGGVASISIAGEPTFHYSISFQ